MSIITTIYDEDDIFPSLEEVVAQIQAAPPNPHSLRPAQGSLVDALRDSPNDPDFDLDVWNQEWATVEAEMKAMASGKYQVESVHVTNQNLHTRILAHSPLANSLCM